VASPLLLDEMFPEAIADQLRAKGHDVRAVVTTPAFAGLPDEEVLIGAAEAGRALVTANIKDSMPINARYRAAGRTHAGLIMVSTKTFPQNRTYVVAVTTALNSLLAAAFGGLEGRIVFLQRA
jgi:nucleoside-diphosphate-sugar epimerase